MHRMAVNKSVRRWRSFASSLSRRGRYCSKKVQTILEHPTVSWALNQHVSAMRSLVGFTALVRSNFPRSLVTLKIGGGRARQHGCTDAVVQNRAFRTTNLNAFFSTLLVESPERLHNRILCYKRSSRDLGGIIACNVSDTCALKLVQMYVSL